MTDAILSVMNYNLFLTIVVLVSVLDVCYAGKRHSHGIMRSNSTALDTAGRANSVHTNVLAGSPKAHGVQKATDTLSGSPKAHGVQKATDTLSGSPKAHGVQKAMDTLTQSVQRKVPTKKNTLAQHITSYAKALAKN
jgi:hypothetical protein